MVLENVEESDLVVKSVVNRTKPGWTITKISLEEKKTAGPREARKLLHITCKAPDGNSYDYSYNYLKLKRSL